MVFTRQQQNLPTFKYWIMRPQRYKAWITPSNTQFYANPYLRNFYTVLQKLFWFSAIFQQTSQSLFTGCLWTIQSFLWCLLSTAQCHITGIYLFIKHFMSFFYHHSGQKRTNVNSQTGVNFRFNLDWIGFNTFITYTWFYSSLYSVTTNLRSETPCSLFKVWDSSWALCWDTRGTSEITNVWSWVKPYATLCNLMHSLLCGISCLHDSEVKTCGKILTTRFHQFVILHATLLNHLIISTLRG